MSNKFLNKVKYFMGLDDYQEDDEDFIETSMEEEEEIVPLSSKKNKIVNIHTTTQMKVVIYEPSEFEEAPSIVDNLKNRKPVIINLENLDQEIAKKIFDFLNGAVYALDGNIQKVSKGIFILAPNNVDISGNLREELRNKGLFPWQK
ncbi:cell division inhibitor SepF [Geosporobacter subterraneus DSM 17957]|uniref:Cell division protein SepF n=1 Tax=Geosporobacter subterraneus DSM 17957 TaxID=1121919 RepID=A0A1M6GTI2_9FIRM|nr:cell division protein SepF [Geosporobacter subterraneus]SHJ13255.1 cell division inhibitor SepF [Geosporobacter subterraneus DSM 17957]